MDPSKAKDELDDSYTSWSEDEMYENLSMEHTVEDKPAAEEKPTDDEKPVLDEKPVVDEKPAFVEKPVTEEKPPVDEKPAVEEKPAVVDKPVVEETPNVVEKPAVEEKPAVVDKPVVEETPNVVEKPAVGEKQAGVEKQVVEGKPANEKPAIYEKPAVNEKLFVEGKPAVEVKPESEHNNLPFLCNMHTDQKETQSMKESSEADLKSNQQLNDASKEKQKESGEYVVFEAIPLFKVIRSDQEHTDNRTENSNSAKYDLHSSSDISKPGIIPFTSSINEQSDSDDNIPLARLKTVTKDGCGLKLSVKRKLIESGSSDDDSQCDTTYKPNIKDLNSSDSDEHEDLGLKKKKKDILEQEFRKAKLYRQKRSSVDRKKGWMKKPTRITPRKLSPLRRQSPELIEKLKRRKTDYENRRKSEKVKALLDIQTAKRKSSQLHTVKMIIQKYHERRLDQLLHGNELRRVPVDADGNCFFTAISRSAGLEKNQDELRSEICEYLRQNVNKYIGFCTSNQSESEPYNQETFQREIDQLERDGIWNVSLGDCLPLAIADKFQWVLRIYSSSIDTPVVDIKPTNHLSTVRTVNLAYVAVRGEEHYEAVDVYIPSKNDLHETNVKQRVKPTPKKSKKPSSPCVTPHKRAKYQSPPKKLSSRKKKKNPENWKRNIRKQKRCSGQAYSTVSGKKVEARSVKAQNCSKCRFKCNSKFSEESRQEIFDFYYNLNSFERQRDYLCDMVEISTPVRSKKKKRFVSKQYFLPSQGKKERVCREFFMRTLDVKRKTIDYTVKRKQHGAFCGQDKRGKGIPSNKISKENVAFVHEHIKSFPKMESHYARKKSSREYLSNDLNIKQMWRLYNDECSKKDFKPVKLSKYRQLFCENYNLSFFKPKKDQCSICTKFDRNKESGDIDKETEKVYRDHQHMKVVARGEKEKDKERAKNDSSFYVATFDLQAVLTTPCCLVSELYYVRKLCCYNLTIYSLADKNTCCHLWDETQGKRGSCEIATCLMKNTMSVCSSLTNIKEITYYSDACGGQNRNKYVAASFLYLLYKQRNLEKINHKFLQSGHSQMECDSVHSAIETAKKLTSIFVPSQWSTIVNLARKSQPYVSVPLKFDHVLNWKKFVNKYCPNMKLSTKREKINWLQIRWIQVRKSAPRSIFINYSFNEDSFVEILPQPKPTRKTSRNEFPEMLERCYDTKLPISVQKKSDLVSLCKKGIIPELYHNYFSSLPTSKQAVDRIPVPASDEESEDTDDE